MHEEAVRVLVREVHLLVHHRHLLRQQLVGALGFGNVARGEQAPDAVPGLRLGERALGERSREDRVARRRGFTRRQEEGPRLGEHVGVVASEAFLERIAGDRDVVARDQGILGAEEVPRGRGAEHLQPLAPQAVRKRGVSISAEKVRDFLGVAALEVAREQPIRGIRLEDVAVEQHAVGLQDAPLSPGRGVARGEELGVVGLGLREGGRQRRARNQRSSPSLDANQGHSSRR